MLRLSRPITLLASAALVCALGLVGARRAHAEVAAPGIHNGILSLSRKGVPSVAYVRGTTVAIATRVKKGRWRTAKAGTVSSGSRVMAFKVGSKGPVALVRSADSRRLVLVRKRPAGWQRVQLAARLAAQLQLGWPGLALDRRGLPVVAYTRWNRVTFDSQLLLVRVDKRGRLSSRKVTAEGFPQSYTAPPAAPVLVGGRFHVIESYGFGTVVGTIEWYPDKRTWTGLFIDVGRGDFPVGPIFAGTRPAGTLYAAWTQSMVGLGAVPVTLAKRARSTAQSEFVLDRALTTALALPSSGPEIAANEWVAADELGLAGAGQVWAGTVVGPASRIELDGRIAGLAAVPGGGRDLLLDRPAGLSWFRSPRRLATRVTLAARTRDDGSVSVSGLVEGVSRGRITLYRERPGSPRETAGRASISGGSFSFADRPSTRPLLYRAVYTDPATRIPYAALLRRQVR